MGNVADMTREEEILHHTILNGLMFDQYSKNLMHLIKEMAIITPAEYIIRQVKWGRVAMQKLREHYDDKSEGKNRRTQAMEALNKLHYCHEHTFPFENYITSFQSNFQMLGRFDDPLYEEGKLIYLINDIQMKNNEWKTTI